MSPDRKVSEATHLTPVLKYPVYKVTKEIWDQQVLMVCQVYLENQVRQVLREFKDVQALLASRVILAIQASTVNTETGVCQALRVRRVLRESVVQA